MHVYVHFCVRAFVKQSDVPGQLIKCVVLQHKNKESWTLCCSLHSACQSHTGTCACVCEGVCLEKHTRPNHSYEKQDRVFFFLFASHSHSLIHFKLHTVALTSTQRPTHKTYKGWHGFMFSTVKDDKPWEKAQIQPKNRNTHCSERHSCTHKRVLTHKNTRSFLPGNGLLTAQCLKQTCMWEAAVLVTAYYCALSP